MTDEKADRRRAGAIARAKSLSPEERSGIARKAALTRHRKDMPRAIAEGTLWIGEIAIPCAVLDDKENTRVLSQNGFLKAIGRHPFAPGGTGSSIDDTAPFLRAKNLKPFIDSELERSSSPLIYLTKNPTAGIAGIGYGYKGTLLPGVCSVLPSAMTAGKLLPSQIHVGEAARELLKALTNYAIDDLIDKATGFGDMRKMAAIFKILDACVAKEKLQYIKMFDIDFYRLIYKLNNWPFDPENHARPGVIGHWTNDIYDRLAPGIREELHARVKRNEKGRPKEKLTQYLTKDDGKPRLKELLEGVKALMRYASDWKHFTEMLDVSYPKFDPIPALPFPDGLPRLPRSRSALKEKGSSS